MSNEARHRDIAALLARGVIRVRRSPLAAKAIESHMPDSKPYSAEQPSEGESMQADDHPLPVSVRWMEKRSIDPIADDADPRDDA